MHWVLLFDRMLTTRDSKIYNPTVIVISANGYVLQYCECIHMFGSVLLRCLGVVDRKMCGCISFDATSARACALDARVPLGFYDTNRAAV